MTEPKHWAVFWEEFKSRHPELGMEPAMPLPVTEAPPMPPQAPEAHEREVDDSQKWDIPEDDDDT